MDELDRRRADDVHSRSELAGGEGLAYAEVCGGAGEVREDDLRGFLELIFTVAFDEIAHLHVQWAGHDVANQQEPQRVLP